MSMSGHPCIYALSGPNGMFVYFIRAGKKGAIKIGHAKSVQRRLDQCQVGNAFKLHIIATIPCSSKAHAVETERRLHNHFRRQRIRGEWFQGNIEFKRALEKMEKQDRTRNEIARRDREARELQRV